MLRTISDAWRERQRTIIIRRLADLSTSIQHAQRRAQTFCSYSVQFIATALAWAMALLTSYIVTSDSSDAA